MGDDIPQMIVCLRDGKEAVEQLKAMYPEEANNVAPGIKTKLVSWHCNIKPLSAQPEHQHPKPKPMSLCLLRTLLPRVMTATEASLWADSATH